MAIQADSLRALVSTNALITAGLLKVKSAVLAFFRTPLIVAVPLKGANTRLLWGQKQQKRAEIVNFAPLGWPRGRKGSETAKTRPRTSKRRPKKGTY